jgi:hypothetical protein
VRSRIGFCRTSSLAATAECPRRQDSPGGDLIVWPYPISLDAPRDVQHRLIGLRRGADSPRMDERLPVWVRAALVVLIVCNVGAALLILGWISNLIGQTGIWRFNAAAAWRDVSIQIIVPCLVLLLVTILIPLPRGWIAGGSRHARLRGWTAFGIATWLTFNMGLGGLATSIPGPQRSPASFLNGCAFVRRRCRVRLGHRPRGQRPNGTLD